MTYLNLCYDVNLSLLFQDLPLTERPAAAARAGFDSVEMSWPFEAPTLAGREFDILQRSLADAGTQLVALGLDTGDTSTGARGLASVPGQTRRFLANVDAAVGMAETTGCQVLNTLYGNRVGGVDAAVQDDLAVENLALACAAAKRIGATIALEPLNSRGNPDYPLSTSDAAFTVIDRVRSEGHHNIALLADLYHLQSSGEDLRALVVRHADRIGHIQIADAPGRHQPGTGGLDFDTLLGLLDAVRYRGFIGLEYTPLGQVGESLDWLPRSARPTRA